MKKILTITSSMNWTDGKPFQDIAYQSCYEKLYTIALENDLEMHRASIEWYDAKKNIFTKSWTYNGNQWKKSGVIAPDLIYDKTRPTIHSQIFKNKIKNLFPIINEPEFTSLIDNKLYNNLLFPSFFKPYFRINSSRDLVRIAEKTPGELIVVKPVSDSGGNDVRVIHKNELSSLSISSSLIAQEFIDSSKGISGICNSTHDLRLVFINEELIYSYIRVPKKGSYLANLAQGGSMMIVELKDIPASVLTITDEIANRFSEFPIKTYTVDFMFDENEKPWVIELNSMPGMYFSSDQEKWMRLTYLKLVESFKLALDSSRKK